GVDEHNTPDLDLPLTQKSFVDEPAVLDHLGERVHQDPQFKQQLHDYIEQSKTDKQWRTAASNAITILVRAEVQFIHTDLRGIRIPYADLSYGVFESAQLQGADLRHVNLRGSWLKDADLSKAKMMGVQFGERPYWKGRPYICLRSPNGTSLSLVGNDTIDVYSLPSLEKLWTLGGHTSMIRKTVYSPDGHQLASCAYDNTTRLWDIKSGICSHVLRCQEPHLYNQRRLYGVAYSPKGDLIATAGTNSTVQLWDTNSGECLSTLVGNLFDINCVVFSPDGNHVASGCGTGAIRLWNIHTMETFLLTGHNGMVEMMVFSLQGNRLIFSRGRERTVQVWDVATKECLLVFTGRNNTCPIRYSPRDEEVAIAGEDDTINLWDTLSGTRLRLEGHGGYISDLDYSPKGDLLASCSFDYTVRVWDTATGACNHKFTGHSNLISHLCFLPQGDQVLSGSDDMTIRLWDVATQPSHQAPRGHDLSVDTIKHSPKGDQVATCGAGGTVRLWDLESGRCLHNIKGHKSYVYTIVYSPEGDMIASRASGDDPVRIWNTETGACIQTVAGHTNVVNGIAFSPGGGRLATSCNENVIRVWSVESGHCLHSLVGHTDIVCAVDYSPDGSRIVTCSYDSTIRFWDTETGDNCLTICGDNESFFFLLYSPRGDQIVTLCIMGSNAYRISVWDTTTGERRFDLPDGNRSLYDIASTPIGELIATSGSTTDHTIRLWDVRSGECLHVLSGHEQDFNQARFSPLGNMIASGSSDRTVRIWDVVSGECLAAITGFRNSVRGIAWSHNSTGDYLVAACAEGSLGRWRVVMDGGQCRVQLCWRLTRGVLSLEGTNIQDAQGLSQVDRRLLEQRGAVGKPAEIDAKEAN
ncbi:hypothetical protein BGX31_000656, partial [Mortierella sp. GBA43]